MLVSSCKPIVTSTLMAFRPPRRVRCSNSRSPSGPSPNGTSQIWLLGSGSRPPLWGTITGRLPVHDHAHGCRHWGDGMPPFAQPRARGSSGRSPSTLGHVFRFPSWDLTPITAGNLSTKRLLLFVCVSKSRSPSGTSSLRCCSGIVILLLYIPLRISLYEIDYFVPLSRGRAGSAVHSNKPPS
jgi:hypothetical protein